MAVTRTTFLVRFPEFNRASEPLIDAYIEAASLQVDDSVWGDKADLGVELTAAHLLALSPFGQQARMVNKDGSTTYGERLSSMQRQVAGGPWLVC
jgi:hypothetical protein